MANISDTIRNNARRFKLGGQLGETSTEELQSLAASSERPSVPTSPLEAGVIGAEPDSAKMAGVPPNKLNALRQSIRADMSLTDAQRREQARKQATAAEQAQQAEGQQLQGLGDMQSRVQQLADQVFTGQGQQFVQAMKADTAKLQAALPPGTDTAQAETLLNKLGANQATPQDILELGKMFGITSAADMGALEKQLKDNFLSQSEQAGQMAAAGIQDTITVGSLSPEQLQSMGFTDLNAMATALNVTPEQLTNTTIGQLKGTFGTLRGTEFSQVDQLKAMLADPARSSAEKAQAMKMLREAGAVGTAASEQGIQRLEDQIAEANTVKFFGKDYSIEELLSNENVSGLVKNYMDNPEIQKQLKEQEPEFAKWIEDNKEVLAQAARDVDDDIASFSKIQTENLAMAKVPDAGVTLSDDVMKEMFTDWGELRAEALEDTPLLQVLHDTSIPAEFKGSLATATNQLADIDKALVKDLANTTYDEMAAAGLSSPAGITSYVNYASKVKNLQSLPPDAAISEAFQGMSDADMEELVKETQVMNASGLTDPANDDILYLMDADKNNILDDPAARKANVMTYITKGKGSALTVKEMAAKGIKAQELPDPLADVRDLKANIQSSSDIYQRVAPFIRDGDGILTGSEVSKMVKENEDMTIDDLATIHKRLKLKDDSTNKALEDAIGNKARSIINDELKVVGHNTKTTNRLIEKALSNKLSNRERDELNAIYRQVKVVGDSKELKNPLAQIAVKEWKKSLYDAINIKFNELGGVANPEKLKAAPKAPKAKKASKLDKGTAGPGQSDLGYNYGE